MKSTLRNSHRIALFCFAILSAVPPVTYATPNEPKIYDIGWVRLRVTDLEKTKHFYKELLGLKEFPNGCFTRDATCFWINGHQKLELIRTVSPTDLGGLDRIGFSTGGLKKMRRYLISRGLKPETIQSKNGRQYFEVSDFEDHRVAFVSSFENVDYVFSTISSTVIHAGFVVHDRAAEDRFYKDILGFHVYWHGGMKEGEDHWVDMQVPDGTDWIEYMLNVPTNADHHTLGVMNHIALGVP